MTDTSYPAEVSADEINELYQQARRLYGQKKYQESSTIFTLLTTLNPNIHYFWIGLGLSHQEIKQYETALVAYDMASWVDQSDPAPFVYAADCYLSLKGNQLAIQSLDKAIQRANDHQEYLAIKNEALKKRALLVD